MRGQDAVVTSTETRTATEPCIKATAPHFHHATQKHDGIMSPLRVDEGKPHRLSLAKKAAAFFKIARSMRNTETSRRSCSNAGFWDGLSDEASGSSVLARRSQSRKRRDIDSQVTSCRCDVAFASLRQSHRLGLIFEREGWALAGLTPV